MGPIEVVEALPLGQPSLQIDIALVARRLRIGPANGLIVACWNRALLDTLITVRSREDRRIDRRRLLLPCGLRSTQRLLATMFYHMCVRNSLPWRR